MLITIFSVTCYHLSPFQCIGAQLCCAGSYQGVSGHRNPELAHPLCIDLHREPSGSGRRAVPLAPAPLRPSSLHLVLKWNNHQYPGHYFRQTEPGGGTGAVRGTTSTSSEGGFRPQVEAQPQLCRPSPWASKRSMKRLLPSGCHQISSPQYREVCSQDWWGVWGSRSMPTQSGRAASCLPTPTPALAGHPTGHPTLTLTTRSSHRLHMLRAP